MNELPVILAIDIGTSASKLLLVRHDGHIVTTYRVEHYTRRPHPGWAEQDPEATWQAIRDGLRHIIAGKTDPIIGIVFSSAMHSVLAVGSNGAPITPNIIWSDLRASGVADRIRQQGRALDLHQKTGTQVHAMSPLCKLIWLRENEPDLFRAATRFVSIKEYILHELCGEWIVDHSVASSSGLFDLDTRFWSASAMTLAGIDPGQLSELRSTLHIARLKREIARDLDLADATPVIIGATNGPLSNLGVGAVKPGVAALTLNANGAVRTILSKPAFDEDRRLFCYALTDRDWVSGGVMNNGGLALDWAAEALGFANIADLYRAAERSEPGAHDAWFAPLITPERFSAFRAGNGGFVSGFKLQHSRDHLARAAVEGVGYLLSTIVSHVETVTGPLKEIRVGGDCMTASFPRRLLADMTGRRIVVPNVTEPVGLGAARMGFRALGADKDWDRAAQVSCSAAIEPNPATVAYYREWRQRAVALYRRESLQT